jgi:hypothetical protein
MMHACTTTTTAARPAALYDTAAGRRLAMAQLHDAEQAVARLEAIVVPAMQWAQELDAQGAHAEAGMLRWEVMPERQRLTVQRLLVAELEQELARTALRPGVTLR